MRLKCLAICILSACSLCAQTSVEDIIYWQQQWLDDAELISDEQEIQSRLEHWNRHPLNINTANVHQLISSAFFGQGQAIEILNYRLKFGAFLSTYELLRMPSIDQEQVKHLLAYVAINSSSIYHKTLLDKEQIIHSSKFVSPKFKGQLNGNYLGNRFEQRVQYKLQRQQLSVGIQVEKDAYEPWWNAGRPLAYSSAFIGWDGKGRLQKIILGDYRMHWGQALLLSTHPLAFQTTGVLSIKARAASLQGNTSFAEESHLRGLALEFGQGKWGLQCILSRRRRSAKIQEEGLVNHYGLGNGLYRTATEINNKEQLQDGLLGMSIYRSDKRGKWSVQSIVRNFNRRLAVGSAFFGKPYSQNKVHFGYSVSMEQSIDQFLIFGELANQGRINSTSYVAGILHQLPAGFSHACYIKSIAVSHHSLQSFAMAHWSDFAGERSFIYLLRKQKGKQSAEVRYERHYKQKPSVQLPGILRNHRILVTAKKEMRHKGVLRVQLGIRPRLIAESGKTKQIVRKGEVQLNLNHRLQVCKSIGSQTQLIIRHRSKQEQSAAIIQKFNYSPSNSSWKLVLQHAFHPGISTGLPLYWYESSLPGRFPWRSQFYPGWSTVIHLKLPLNQRLGVQLKYHGLFQNPLKWKWEEDYSIGTGMDSILGNRKHTFALLIHWKK